MFSQVQKGERYIIVPAFDYFTYLKCYHNHAFKIIVNIFRYGGAVE